MAFSPIPADKHYLDTIKSLVCKDANDFKLRDYPPIFDHEDGGKIRIKDFRDKQLKHFKNVLENLYEKKVPLVVQNIQNNKYMTNYSFRPEIAGFNLRAVEVTCRMFSHYDGGSLNVGGNSGKPDSSNTNLGRIGSIKFKGELQNVINQLLVECMSYMTMKRGEPNKNDAVCYTSQRCCHPPYINDWPCKRIEKVTLDHNENVQNYYASHHQSTGSGKDINTCFFQRQPIGQAFVPYIDLSDWKNDSLIENFSNYDETNEEKKSIALDDESYFYQSVGDDGFVFNNLFISYTNNLVTDASKGLSGIYKKDIRCDADNFLTMGNCVCTALIDFQLDKIGVCNGSGNINLYIKPRIGTPILCTSAKSEIDIPTAREYLTNLLLENPKYRKYLIGEGLVTEECFRNIFSSLDMDETRMIMKGDDKRKVDDVYDQNDDDDDDDDDDAYKKKIKNGKNNWDENEKRDDEKRNATDRKSSSKLSGKQSKSSTNVVEDAKREGKKRKISLKENDKKKVLSKPSKKSHAISKDGKEKIEGKKVKMNKKMKATRPPSPPPSRKSSSSPSSSSSSSSSSDTLSDEDNSRPLTTPKPTPSPSPSLSSLLSPISDEEERENDGDSDVDDEIDADNVKE